MTPTATLATTADVQSASRIRRLVVRHPVGAYLLLAYPIGWTLRVGLTLVGAPNQLSETAATLVGIAAPAVLITYLGSGGDGVRRLLSGVARWRIGFGRLAFVVGAVPAMTLAVAAATGTLGNPTGGWAKLVLTGTARHRREHPRRRPAARRLQRVWEPLRRTRRLAAVAGPRPADTGHVRLPGDARPATSPGRAGLAHLTDPPALCRSSDHATPARRSVTARVCGGMPFVLAAMRPAGLACARPLDPRPAPEPTHG
jgi:hypothetical protein